MDETLTTIYGDVIAWVGNPIGIGGKPVLHYEAVLKGKTVLNGVVIEAATGFGDTTEEARNNLVSALVSSAQNGGNTFTAGGGFAITSGYVMM